MSKETISLRVPSKPAAEYVEHGNFAAELKPKAVISVTDRRFADWLVVEFGCAEVGDEPAAGGTSSAETTDGSGEGRNKKGE